jgi:hypothetical protein
MASSQRDTAEVFNVTMHLVDDCPVNGHEVVPPVDSYVLRLTERSFAMAGDDNNSLAAS